MNKSKTTSNESNAHHILIVDDCEVIRVVTQQYLERKGYVVEIAENGRQALELLKSNPFDLILMDLSMPDMDGFEAARRIRNAENKMRIADCGMRNEKSIQSKINSEIPGPDHECACSDNKDQPQKHSCSEKDCKCRRTEVDQNLISDIHNHKSEIRNVYRAIVPGDDGGPKSEIERVPIIGMSGHDPQSVKEECYDAGINDCVGKLLQQETLVSVVREWTTGELDIPRNNITQDRSLRLRTNAAKNQPPIDIEKTITEFMGKKDLLWEVLTTFKTRVRAQIMNIKQYITVKDFNPILSEAHSIKGGAGNLGALNLSQAAAELEEAAGEGSSSRANAAIDDLENEFQRLYQFIEQSDMSKAISK